MNTIKEPLPEKYRGYLIPYFHKDSKILLSTFKDVLRSDELLSNIFRINDNYYNLYSLKDFNSSFVDGDSSVISVSIRIKSPCRHTVIYGLSLMSRDCIIKYDINDNPDIVYIMIGNKTIEFGKDGIDDFSTELYLNTLYTKLDSPLDYKYFLRTIKLVHYCYTNSIVLDFIDFRYTPETQEYFLSLFEFLLDVPRCD